MSFSISHIKGTNIEVTSALHSLVTQKLSTLEKFIHEETDVVCDVELERSTNQHSGDIFRAEVNLFRKGKLFRAEATTDQIEKSIDEVRDEIQQELRKANDKSHSLAKRGRMMIKRMMQFGRPD